MNNGLFGQPQQMPQQNIGFPQGMPPQGMPQQYMQRNDPFMMPPTTPNIQQPQLDPRNAEIDAMNAAVQQKLKYSVGNPTVDKYINIFLGE